MVTVLHTQNKLTPQSVLPNALVHLELECGEWEWIITLRLLSVTSRSQQVLAVVTLATLTLAGLAHEGLAHGCLCHSCDWPRL